MRASFPDRQPLHCILPPYLLESIAAHGTPAQRAMARRSLAIDTRLRRARAAGSPPAPAGGRPPRGEKRRTIYSARHLQTLPGTVVRPEGRPDTGDAAADEAYAGLGSTYDFFWTACSRHSIDDEGLPLDATVHFGTGYNNAFWNGRQMVFGDGDGDLFKRFTSCPDVIAHELAHGVTDHTTRLLYSLQAGALNESVSDVFGSLVKQWTHGETAEQADWLIGASLFTSKVHGRALRSMKAPGSAYDDPVLGKDPQPAHFRDFVRTDDDNGGVHINSGIPNRAFYLVASGLGGPAWERAGRIWYDTIRDRAVRPSSGFKAFARRTVANAARLHGPDAEEARVAREAWQQVGIAL